MIGFDIYVIGWLMLLFVIVLVVVGDDILI